MHGRDLQARTKQFALRVLRLCAALPRTIASRIIAHQLGRAGTSVGANYRAVCRARSRADSVHQLGVVEEQADERCFGLELVVEGPFARAPRRVAPLLQEANEILSTIVASRITAKRRTHAESAIGDR